MTIWLTILAIIILLIISAFFSGSETALTAASKARMHALEKEGNKRAGVVNKLINAKDKLIGTILIGNNLVNILASVLATGLFLNLYGQAGMAIATAVMTVLVVLFSEILPKTLAITNPDKMALRTAPVLRPIVWALSPITKIVNRFMSWILGRLGHDKGSEDGLLSVKEELRGAIDLHHKEGAVIKDDRDMLGGVLDLRSLDIEDVMVHRTKMEMVDSDDTPQEIVDQVLSSSYSRLPVWTNKTENITGVIHAKDVLRALSECDWDVNKIDIGKLANKPWFVPESTNLQDQLNAFLKKKTHFAMVVDEYGDLMGLITLEDILEEIVGEIHDEYDLEQAGIHRNQDGSVDVEGAFPVRDLNRILDWDLPDEEATTLAGLVIHEAQTIPAQSQMFTFYNFRFTILAKEKNKLTLIKIMPLEQNLKRAPIRRKTPGKQA